MDLFWRFPNRVTGGDVHRGVAGAGTVVNGELWPKASSAVHGNVDSDSQSF